MKRPTIADIARRAGVSKVAVSYALNDQPGVSVQTRVRIKAIAEEVGWRPSSAARALNGARARAVGLAVCRPARTLSVEPFFMELISGIESVLAPRSIALMLQTVAGQNEEIELYRRWWGEGRVDGALLVDLRDDDTRVPALAALELPVVALGPPQAAGGLTAVWSDDGASVLETVAYLAALGHRHIARVAGLPGLAHTTVRDTAFAAGCRTAGLPEPVVVHTDYSGDEGARATRRLLAPEISTVPGISDRRPSAIVYDNDIMAVAGLSVAQELHLDVPRDLSLVAWDDSPFTRAVRPQLSALTRDIAAYGACAARTLLASVDDERVESIQIAPARLVPRASTGLPRSA
ncbi:LacI family DNA-binding transcriptional regulator [Streptomyces tsukubensis]|uniref:LacI family transcriptional regulator n=1 Tax=Streptomyces tsukubensis TaxID=83656 RepID=A0A1V4ACB0_9ACTN|nr:LacI family DNA-binding transcriptional regulator [Streptomyces tsukubensis]OON81594.1 LacI family transcriptional regulator [Streptomyces tsukubensis]QFR96367.1 LacI family DNA-binding transcriptional regulator [Streptomyces tsukubensis]